jgi:translation initiation factor 4G
MRPPQNNDPNDGPPRSPQYSRQMPNGNGPRSQDGGPPAGLSSLRLGPPHNNQGSMMPPPQSQIQPMWYYVSWNLFIIVIFPILCPFFKPPADQQHFVPYQQWYSPMQMPPQHQPSPHQPHPSPQMPHTEMPMSPRNPPSALQGPATPTLSHAIASPVHAPHPLPSHIPQTVLI